jgi:hypothetical protein
MLSAIAACFTLATIPVNDMHGHCGDDGVTIRSDADTSIRANSRQFKSDQCHWGTRFGSEHRDARTSRPFGPWSCRVRGPRHVDPGRYNQQKGEPRRLPARGSPEIGLPFNSRLGDMHETRPERRI